jgi:hypothetical protein
MTGARETRTFGRLALAALVGGLLAVFAVTSVAPPAASPAGPVQAAKKKGCKKGKKGAAAAKKCKKKKKKGGAAVVSSLEMGLPQVCTDSPRAGVVTLNKPTASPVRVTLQTSDANVIALPQPSVTLDRGKVDATFLAEAGAPGTATITATDGRGTASDTLTAVDC